MPEKRRSQVERNQERDEAVLKHELKLAHSRLESSRKNDPWKNNETKKPGKIFQALGWLIFALLIFAIIKVLKSSWEERKEKPAIEQSSSEQ